MNQRILIVEDEAAIQELVSVNLRHAGFQVSIAPTASAAQSLVILEKPDLIVLDWMLPDMQGIDLARKLRDNPETRETPIIMLTARAQEGDKLMGFEAGADDYVTKPFSPRELVARVRALIRRAPSDATDNHEQPLQAGNLRLEPHTHRVYADGHPLELSPTEFKLLGCLMRKPDRVMSRTYLLDEVWGNQTTIEERTVDVHIRRLRLALKPSGLSKAIETVRSSGYRFNPNLSD